MSGMFGISRVLLGWTEVQGNSFPDQLSYEAGFRNTTETVHLYSQSDLLWTRADLKGQSSGILDNMKNIWELDISSSGQRSRKKIEGTVKDSSGNPVSNATVKLFNTSTGVLVDTAVSKTDGKYQAADPNNVASFAVGYLDAATDTAGTTVNTLTGV